MATSAIGDGEPTWRHINRWYRDSVLRTSWYNFAVELVGKNDAEIIRTTYFGGGNHWYDSTADHSWQMIVDALQEVKEIRVIESIEKHCQA